MTEKTLDEFGDETPTSDPDGDAEPTRFDCLVCDETKWFQSRGTVQRHVEEIHSARDVWATYINTPRRTDFDPDATDALQNGRCSICEIEPGSYRRHMWNHDATELYDALLAAVPDEYDHAPTYDDYGRDDPKGTALELVPGDAVTVTVEGWEMSSGTKPHRAPRARAESDETWTFTGTVIGVEDDRDDLRRIQRQNDIPDEKQPLSFKDVGRFDGHREVQLQGDAEIWGDEGESSGWYLETSIDGDGPIRMKKTATFDMDMGAGGDAPPQGRVAEIERTPWYEREESIVHE